MTMMSMGKTKTTKARQKRAVPSKNSNSKLKTAKRKPKRVSGDSERSKRAGKTPGRVPKLLRNPPRQGSDKKKTTVKLAADTAYWRNRKRRTVNAAPRAVYSTKSLSAGKLSSDIKPGTKFLIKKKMKQINESSLSKTAIKKIADLKLKLKNEKSKTKKLKLKTKLKKQKRNDTYARIAKEISSYTKLKKKKSKPKKVYIKLVYKDKKGNQRFISAARQSAESRADIVSIIAGIQFKFNSSKYGENNEIVGYEVEEIL